jgi:hypothetical protein
LKELTISMISALNNRGLMRFTCFKGALNAGLFITFLSRLITDVPGQLDANIVPVATCDEGLQRVVDGKSDVFFGNRPILFVTAKRSSSAEDLIVLPRYFTRTSGWLSYSRVALRTCVWSSTGH